MVGPADAEAPVRTRVRRDQRFTRDNPCPCCGGSADDPHGLGIRCWGFFSDDGEWIFCTREEYAGSLEPHGDSEAYRHRAYGSCHCGREHQPLPRFDPWAFTTTYDYSDGDELLFQVCRYAHPKTFRQRRPLVPTPDPRDDNHWKWDLDGIVPVLYRLDELRAAPPDAPVFIPEGERDVDRLRALGLVATTNPMGAGKWRPEFRQWLAGCHVVIIPDNDDAGKRHVEEVQRSLHGVAPDVRLLRLPGLPPGGDVSDWIDAGGTREQLLELVSQIPNSFPAHIEGETKNESADWSDGFPAVSLRDFLEEEDEETAYIVDGMLPSSGLSVFAAKPKVGKTTTVSDLAVSVGRGEPFLGRSTTPVRTLLLAFEEKRGELRHALRRLDAAGDALLDVFVGIAPDNSLDMLRRSIESHSYGFVIVDTLQRLLHLSDLNDYATVSNAIEPIIALARQTGVHILLTHHANKLGGESGDAVLGSTAIFGSVDTLIEMRREEGGLRTIWTQQRYGTDLEKSVLEMDPRTRHVTLGGSKEDHDVALAQEEILAALERAKKPCVRGEIEEFTKGIRAQVRTKALDRLVADGRVTRVGEGKRGSPYLFSFPASIDPETNSESHSNGHGHLNRQQSAEFEDYLRQQKVSG